MKKICLVFWGLFISINISAQETDLKMRMAMLDICETLNAAYNMKDSDYIEKYFGDQLFILNNNDSSGVSKDYKEEYIKELKRFWKSENCRFFMSDVETRASVRYPDLYSISFQHDWVSNRETKKGYIFLIFDFRDTMNPIAHACVCTTGEKSKIKYWPRIEDFDFGL